MSTYGEAYARLAEDLHDPACYVPHDMPEGQYAKTKVTITAEIEGYAPMVAELEDAVVHLESAGHVDISDVAPDPIPTHLLAIEHRITQLRVTTDGNCLFRPARKDTP